MFNNTSILGLILARGGSKGVPGKNVYNIAGKPLIAWTIESARKSRFIDRLILSSDDEEIIDVAKKYQCEVPFVRDEELAKDDTPGTIVVLDAIERCGGYDYVVLLQPTSPLRTTEDIDSAISFCFQHSAPFCVSICEVEENPYWMFTLEESKQMKPLMQNKIPDRRQDLPIVYSLNGAIYVAEINSLKEKGTFITDETIGFEMPKERSLDIDTMADINLAEQRLKLETH